MIASTLRLTISSAFVLPGLCAWLLACESAPPEPKPRTQAEPQQESPSDKGSEDPTKAVGAAKTGSPSKPGKVDSGASDPLEGKFSLDDATAGLKKEGVLSATIDTSLGSLDCELYADKAPTTVANFVGLARGLRPFKYQGQWVKRPAYDGTTFHRVIKGFMIQGGDPEGTGRGEPGYVIPDEIWDGAKHDKRGLLCMANRGPNTNGMQFFITDASAPHLDRSYTIFGKCGPDSVIEKLASTETHGRNAPPGKPADRPLSPPEIRSIKIQRK